MMSVAIRSKLGVSLEEANSLLPEAQNIASRFPLDATVLVALAEAEVDARHYPEAIAVADTALAIDANNIDAHIQKGYAMAHLAKEIDDTTEKSSAWKGVRQQFVKANGFEPENPLPLVHFYLSFIDQGIEPTKNSVAGLEWALKLAPFDGRVRSLVAQQQMAEERYVDARKTLVPLAYNPHKAADNAALALLKEAEGKIAEQVESEKASE